MSAVAERRLALADERSSGRIRDRTSPKRRADGAAGGTAPARSAAVRLRASRSTRRRWRERLPDGVDIAAALRRLQAEYAPRGVNLVHVAGKWTFRTANDLAWLLAREVVEPQQAVARRDRDARDHRLSPAGDARRDRGYPRRHHCRRARSTCCWRPAGSACAAAARRRAGRSPTARPRPSSRISGSKRSAICRASTN